MLSSMRQGAFSLVLSDQTNLRKLINTWRAPTYIISNPTFALKKGQKLSNQMEPPLSIVQKSAQNTRTQADGFSG
jgi:hypothetical protein